MSGLFAGSFVDIFPRKRMCAGVLLAASAGFWVSSAVENPPTDWSVIVFRVVMVSGSAKSNIGLGVTGRVNPSRLRAVESSSQSSILLVRCSQLSSSPNLVALAISFWVFFQMLGAQRLTVGMNIAPLSTTGSILLWHVADMLVATQVNEWRRRHLHLVQPW